MGKCPEDGQNLIFETRSDIALDLFSNFETDAWTCRLARICADVYAIYTPELSPDFTGLAADVSLQCGYAYYEIVFDEPAIAVWRNGQTWISEIPPGREGKAIVSQLEATVFVDSNTQVEGRLWQLVNDFIWGHFSEAEFLLEK